MGASHSTQPAQRQSGDVPGALGSAMPKLGGAMSAGMDAGSALPKMGSAMGGGAPMSGGMPGASASPFGQGFAGMTATQSTNPNMGGGGAGLGAEVTSPGAGFLSGLMSGTRL